MTSNMTTQPTGQRPLHQGLTRTRDGAILGGVAGGLARRFDISPSWVRLAFIITAFFGGLGVLLYLLGWVAIPQEGSEASLVEDFMADRQGGSRWLGIGLIALAVALLLGGTGFFRFELVLAGALFLAGFLLYRGQLGRPEPADAPGPGPTPPPGPAEPEPTQPPPPPASAVPPSPALPAATPYVEIAETGDDAEASSPPTAATWVSPVVPTYRDRREEPVVPVVAPTVAPRRPPSYLGRITVAALLVTIGVMALLQNADVVSPELRDYVAAGMLVVGAGLLLGTWFGRARGLIFVGLLGVPLLVGATAVRIPMAGDWGEETVRPVTAAELDDSYSHGIGQFVLDLRELDMTADAAVEVEQGIGQLRVLVPHDVSLSVDAEVDAGGIRIFEESDGGFDHSRHFSEDIPGAPLLFLDLEVGAGQIVVEN